MTALGNDAAEYLKLTQTDFSVRGVDLQAAEGLFCCIWVFGLSRYAKVQFGHWPFAMLGQVKLSGLSIRGVFIS